MTRPPLLVRIAGSPLGAVLLFLLYAAIVAGWYEGQVVWWLALGSVGAFMRTLSAVGRVRRYKASMEEWNAMGAREEPAPPRKERHGGRRRLFVTCAVLLVLVIPACLPSLEGNDELGMTLTLLWVVAGIYLIGVVIRSIIRRITKRRTAKPEAATAPVAWMLARASSSPSRSEAAQKLPEYCARLLRS
jgi:hypothetical protein